MATKFEWVFPVSLALMAAAAFAWTRSRLTGDAFDTEGNIPDRATDVRGETVLGAAHVLAGRKALPALVEFTDYECPACRASQDLVSQVTTEYRGRLNVLVANFPLPQHHGAPLAAAAADIASEEGRFVPMYSSLMHEHLPVTTSSVLGCAAVSGLNLRTFYDELQNRSGRETAADKDVARRLALQGTPTYVLCEADGTSIVLGSLANLSRYHFIKRR